ncbi:MAG: hypothetical protein JSS49_27835 [Planctomycetes bacterium]|nr:hypothetical protein [Planctomycetota bacterium]
MTVRSPVTAPAQPSIRDGFVNGFIAIVVVLFALDTLPCTPPSIRAGIEPLLNTTGLWQGTWTLFAPIPDRRNHRLHATIDFTDGQRKIWNSPDWRSQSPWRRFVGHRETEFLEKVWLEENSHVWPAFAQSLVRSEVETHGSERQPKQVVLSVEWGDIPPPIPGQWTPAAIPIPLDHQQEYFRLLYPEQSE